MQITWKKLSLVFSFSPIDLAFDGFFFMSFARFQILISEPQSIWRKLLVLSWLYKPAAQKSWFLKNHLLRTSKVKIMKWNVLLLDTQSSYILRSPQNFAQSSPYFCLYILTVGKSKVDILQNFVALSEYTNFTIFFVVWFFRYGKFVIEIW